MLKHTFIHINGIGLKSERLLWEKGVHSPADIKKPYPEDLPPKILKLINNTPASSPTPKEMAELLSPSQYWRLFPYFRAKTAYLDIETYGHHRDELIITTVALYDGKTVSTYVNGENLEQFIDDIAVYENIVTYNGKGFDIPILAEKLGVRFDQVHMDLRYLLNGIGVVGGLKECERQMGIDRGDLDGVDGYGAVILWAEYRRTGDKRLLETLLAYNVQDVGNLEPLMVQVYNQNLRGTPFEESHAMPLPEEPVLPFRADMEITGKLRSFLTRGII